MDILSPDYRPTAGVTLPAVIELAPIDDDPTTTRAADRADQVARTRAALAELQAEMHQLRLDLLTDDYEVATDAMYRLSDAAERLTGLRFGLEMTL